MTELGTKRTIFAWCFDYNELSLLNFHVLSDESCQMRKIFNMNSWIKSLGCCTYKLVTKGLLMQCSWMISESWVIVKGTGFLKSQISVQYAENISVFHSFKSIQTKAIRHHIVKKHLRLKSTRLDSLLCITNNERLQSRRKTINL